MTNHVEPLEGEPILQDKTANYFGTEGAGFNLRAHLRGNGVLRLFEDRLVFDQYLTGTHIEIPLAEMTALSVGLWHLLKSRGIPVLKITYRGNLVFGVAVSKPERWIEAIENLGRAGGAAPMVEQRAVPASNLRRFRLGAAIILALVVLVAVVLPLFLNWVHRQGVREVDGSMNAPSGEMYDMRYETLERTGTHG